MREKCLTGWQKVNKNSHAVAKKSALYDCKMGIGELKRFA